MTALQSLKKEAKFLFGLTLAFYLLFLALDILVLAKDFDSAVANAGKLIIPVFAGFLFNVLVVQPWRANRKSNTKK